MNQQSRINKIVEAVAARIQDEVGALLGAEFSLIAGERQLRGKETIFEGLSGKKVCTRMDITGETTGQGYLLVGIKDAIRLGGTLIMLPGGELDEVIGREQYNEEVEDSFGEIANIIAGALTKDFEEMYPKPCRFVRKEQEVFIPAKVDIESDSPIASQAYYQVSCTMALDGRNMGDMVLLLPAATFDLPEPEKVERPGLAKELAETSAAADTAARPTVSPDQAQQPIEADTAAEPPPKAAVGPKFNRLKDQKRLDGILAECKKKMEAEFEALLGVDVFLDDLENQFLSKEEFFLDKVTGHQVLTEMEVRGELEGKSYLVISTKDAIHLGGVLNMLPPIELEDVVSKGEFGEDIRDAYGEIAKVVSRVYTAAFEEQYNQKLRFVRKDLRDIVPAKLDTESDDVIPNSTYYSNSLVVVVEGKPLGRMHMLFPADLLQLDGLELAVQGYGKSEEAPVIAGQSAGQLQASGEPVRSAEEKVVQPLDILVVGDDDAERVKIADVLKHSGYAVKTLSFKDNLHNYIPGKLKAIYLVTQQVNEQVFGVAIKVSSACSVPLVAAGPGWTRTKVIKAVKYGIRDILLTPASTEDIEESVNNNLMELAA